MNKLIFSILTLLIFSCATEKRETKPEESKVNEIDEAAELKAIETVRAEFSLALKEGRYEDIGKWSTADIKTVRPGGAGWNEMFAIGQERGRFPYDSIIMQPTETYLVNDSMAYDMGNSRVYYTNREGEKVELRNTFLAILKKENGQWKLHREVGSSIVD